MDSIWNRVITRLTNTRSGERTVAFLMFAYSFLAMTSHNILKPVTKSKFIDQLGSDNLPYVLLASSVLIGMLMHFYASAARRVPRKYVIPITQAILVAVGNIDGVTIVGTKGKDEVSASKSVKGEPLPTGEEDSIKGKGKKDDLSGLTGDDTIRGGKGGDTLRGDAGNDLVKGGKGGDSLKGGDGDDELKGGKGKDKLKGEAGNDRLDGRQSKDTLTGGEGDDTFVFAHPNKKDKVTDFAEGDIIALAKGAFSGIGPLGALDADRFHVGAEADTPKQKILYDEDSGWLLYAKHGSDTADPIRFAKIGKNLDHFDNGDIMVI